MNKKFILWKIYYWLSCVLIVAGISIEFITHPNCITFLEIIDILIGLIAFIGFFGFVYNKAILIERMWKNVFCITLTWEILFSIIYLNFIKEPGMPDSLTISALILTYAYASPMFFALYTYGYSSSNLWERVRT